MQMFQVAFVGYRKDHLSLSEATQKFLIASLGSPVAVRERKLATLHFG